VHTVFFLSPPPLAEEAYPRAWRRVIILRLKLKRSCYLLFLIQKKRIPLSGDNVAPLGRFHQGYVSFLFKSLGSLFFLQTKSQRPLKNPFPSLFFHSLRRRLTADTEIETTSPQPWPFTSPVPLRPITVVFPSPVETIRSSFFSVKENFPL